MKIEVKHIAVKVYRDKDGGPTCASNFEDGSVCQFYGTRSFGTKEICLYGTEIPLERHGGVFRPVEDPQRHRHQLLGGFHIAAAELYRKLETFKDGVKPPVLAEIIEVLRKTGDTPREKYGAEKPKLVSGKG